MSKAWQLGDDNAGSPDALMALFRKLARGGREHTAHEVWDAMLQNSWLQAEAKRRAALFLKFAGLPIGLAEDFAQEALVQLLAKLKSDTSMHANADLLPDTFKGWVGTILDHSFADIAEKLCPARPPHVMVTDDAKTVEHDVTSKERALIFEAALAKLSGTERSVIALHLEGLKLTKIAEMVQISYKAARGALARAKSKLRKWLADYRYTK